MQITTSRTAMIGGSSPLLCPDCHSPLDDESTGLRCPRCAVLFLIEHQIADFSRGHYYDAFDPTAEMAERERLGLANEEAAIHTRVRKFYYPLLKLKGSQPVLDCGCGNGMSVDILNDLGITTWGVDLSSLRKWQWKERVNRHRLVVADAAKLPFPSGYFGTIIASGLIEHIGVRELGIPRYSVEPLSTKLAQRENFLQEMIRVLTPGGRLFLDFPNGSFPIDFWHGDTPGGARFHKVDEGFLPTMRELRELGRRVDPRITVKAISPSGRLEFRQVGAHWYGKLLSPLAYSFFAAMKTRVFSWAAGSALNPYLVVRVDKP